MASSSFVSCPQSYSSSNWRYDVYPSFHAPDVDRFFLSEILKEFRSKGIDQFIDGEIKRSNSLSFDLIEAIRGSRIALVILSKNYVSSVWCLDELVEIIKCKKELGQTVMAIFYKVDPSHVEEVFRETCKGKTKEDTARWRQALQKVVTLAVCCSRNWGNDADMIQATFSDISNILENSESHFKGLVGMEAHLKKMEPLLQLGRDYLRVIGIWGPPGIGKTTIAKCLYQQYSNRFQFSVFMENLEDLRMRDPTLGYKEYNPKLQLKDHFLSKVVKQYYRDITHLGVTQERLKDKEALIVLDDVNSLAQLEALAKETWLFGNGSRIIVTTQDQRLLKAHGINHIYKVDFPPPDEALQIFSMYAFGQVSPFNGFEKLAREVTTLSGKHPLGLRFMGSYFRGMSKEEWKNKLPRLRTSLGGKLLHIIKFTYDSLSGEDRELSHRHISYLGDDELIKRMDQHLAKQFSEVRQELIIANQDLKQDLDTSERGFKDVSHSLQQSIDIYCADTIHNYFANHLSMEFRRKGFYTFVIYSETLEKIEEASASVVVFSNSCFSSTSYLDNLVRVLQYQKKSGQLIIPVFYGISPSDVNVRDYDSRERKREWVNALQELRKLRGYQLKEECSECELVEEIVKDVYEKLFPTEQIGIKSRLLGIEQLLCKQPWGIRRIGIWGMPGIGKSTLAQAFFDQISGGYEASCFINDFDKAFREKGLHHLLEEHFGTFLKELPLVSSSKITLTVLDDVHNPLVAESFLRGINWFGLGSLIIITSRDKQVFRHCQINDVYEVQSLNQNESMRLFSQCTFGKDRSEQNLFELSKEVMDYANGNPLVLSFYCGELKGKTFSHMVTTFLKLKQRTPNKIHDLFKSSYDTLNDIEKNIFLDIACFFNGEKVDYVMQLLEGCGFFPHVGIDVLVEKCLVTISENRVKMHGIIQDFGREIIKRETIQLERRSRLWEPQTIRFLLEVYKLEENEEATSSWAMDTENIEGIFLDASNLFFNVKPTAFEDMLNLRFLKIYYSYYYRTHHTSGVRLPKGLDSLPYELRLLHWEYYPLQSLPQDFDPCHLVELNMPYSQLHKLWGRTKNLKMLKIARFCHSQHLTEIDDICKAPNIELVDLQGCTKLQSFPATGQLQHLRVINLSGCTEIKIFTEVSPNVEELHLEETGIRRLPISTGNITNLKRLYLTGCASLLELPSTIGNASSLEVLDLSDCPSLMELPSSIGNATNLEKLNLKYCSSLVELPFSIGNATNLKKLCLTGCSSLVELPSSIGNASKLKVLDLSDCSSLMNLPSSIGNASRLKILDLSNCSSLMKLPSSIGNFINLEKLNLEYWSSLTELPSSIGYVANLKKLCLTGCSNLLELPSSIKNTTNLVVELPSSIGNTTNLQELVHTGYSSLVERSSFIRKSTNLKSLDLHNLKKMDPSGNPILMQLNVTKLRHWSSLVKGLRILCLSGCSTLVELPSSSIESATNLNILDLSGCSSLKVLPSSIGNCTNLEKLNLENCSSLVELPSSIGNAINLKKLDLKYCPSLVELPSSVGNITNLKKLCLTGCSRLMKLPSSIGNITNLQELNLKYCSSLVELPPSIGNLKKLSLTGWLVDLPSSIRNSTTLMSTGLNEDNNLTFDTFSNNSGSRCLEVRRTKKGNIFVLKGEREDEHSVSLNLRMADGNEYIRNSHFLFYQEVQTASKVSREMVEQLGLTKEYITFIAELIDILLVVDICEILLTIVWYLIDSKDKSTKGIYWDFREQNSLV